MELHYWPLYICSTGVSYVSSEITHGIFLLYFTLQSSWAERKWMNQSEEETYDGMYFHY